jgi:CDP-6-deoxy-D-xylo-4-hexulose-3-dehydrase
MRFFSAIEDDVAGDLEYDDLFIFDEAGWNFEPSELSAAFGLVQLDKLDENIARRQRNFELTAAEVGRWPQFFTLPRLTEGVETGWHMFPFVINADSGIRRSELQQWMESHGVDTRMVWTGNAARQPAFRNATFRQPADGLPNADAVMERGLILPNTHSLDDEDCAYIGECIEGFLVEKGLVSGG